MTMTSKHNSMYCQDWLSANPVVENQRPEFIGDGGTQV